MIEPGDIVFLKSGMYPMTVLSVKNKVVKCIYITKKKMPRTIKFSIDVLMKHSYDDSYKSTSETYCNGWKFTAWERSDEEYFGNYYFNLEKVKGSKIFKVGSVVALKSYPMYMTVLKSQGDFVQCSYFDEDWEIKIYNFPILTLDMYTHVFPDEPEVTIDDIRRDYDSW